MTTLGHGKICHLALPARDVAESARFYGSVFGWAIRRRGDGSTSFDDGVAEVSGHFVTDRSPHEPGPLIYIWVDDLKAAVNAVEEAGGRIVAEPGIDPGERTAWFQDPAGNTLGMYQEP